MSTIKLKKLLTPEKIDKIIEKEEKNIFGFFIKNFRFTYLILIGIVTLGSFAMFTLPKESEPEVKIPYAFVSAIYPGANPSDTEELITNKIEEKIKNIEDLKRYTSSSGVGISSVFVEFEAETDMIDSMNKLKDAVDLAKPSLPKDAQDPIITQLNFSDQSLITYSLVGESYSEAELKYYADILQKKFESIKDVSRAPIIGGLEREFQVIVDQSRLVNYNLSLGQIVSAISRTNFNMPAGDIDIDGFTYNVRVKGKFDNASGLNDVVVANVNETPIYLRDIAQIKDTYKEKSSESRVGVGRNTPSKTVSLQVYKKTGGNILKMVDEANKIVTETKQSEVWPSTLDILKTNDLAVFVRDDFNTLGRSGLQTMVLIVLILSLALGIRAAVIASFSVPIAFLMAFIVIMSQDMTLNSMVLFALVLSLGLMVDNSIIIIEGISEYMGKYNISSYKAGILSVWNYRWPIISGTMTTVCAFAPMLLVSGILGEYIGIMPKTIMATLLSSLFVALIVIPVLASKLIRHTRSEKEYQDNNEGDATPAPDHFQDRKFRPVKKLKEIYSNFMADMIRNKKRRRWTLAVAWIAFVLAATMPVVGLMKIEMFPKVDIDFIVVNIELPVGSVLASTKQIATEVEKIVIDNLPEIDNYVTNIGQSINIEMGFGTGSGSHLASIMVNLQEDRKQKSYEISENLRPLTDKIQGAKVSVLELSAGPPTGAPIEVRIYGEDLKTISLVISDVKNILANMEGVINVDDNLEDTTGEFTFSVDRQKANYYGLDVATVASTLRNAIYGTKASEVLLDGEDIEIIVKYDKSKFSNVSDLENLLIFTAKGPTPLKNIASVQLEPSLLSINHRDGKNTISVSADIEENANLQKILKEFEKQKKELDLPASINIEVGGEVEDIDQSFRELFMSMIVSVLLIAFILVLQFNSFKQPLIIIFSLPLAIPGVMIGLFLTGLAFGFPAFIGIVALSGIVVNDAIVLIDKINKNLKAIPIEQETDNEFYDAIIEAGVARLQPILLTTLTTIAGILPLYFANEIWRGLSVTIAFGLAFSTLLTLIVVPVMYVWLCKKDYDKKHNS
ncbi:MAG: efflux RND transporter permease subunit [Patescibacteria group bacterium]